MENKTENKTPRTGVYVVYCSDRTPAEIHNYLTSFASSKDEVGPVRVVYYQGKETNRNVCVMSSEVYKKLISEGHDTETRKNGLSVCLYYLSDKYYPSFKGSLEIFIKLPLAAPADACRKVLENKLNELKKMKLFEGDFNINIPYKQRSSGVHCGKCIISFEGKIRRKDIALVKIVITDSFWGKDVDPKEKLRIFTNWNRFVNKTKNEISYSKKQRDGLEKFYNKKIENDKTESDDEDNKLEKHYVINTFDEDEEKNGDGEEKNGEEENSDDEEENNKTERYKQKLMKNLKKENSGEDEEKKKDAGEKNKLKK